LSPAVGCADTEHALRVQERDVGGGEVRTTSSRGPFSSSAARRVPPLTRERIQDPVAHVGDIGRPEAERL